MFVVPMESSHVVAGCMYAQRVRVGALRFRKKLY